MSQTDAAQELLFTDDHIHDCECGAWICGDDTCDVDDSRKGGYRPCPFCGED
jgi:hypothetical protein